MNQPIQLFIKSSILDRERQLTVDNDFIEFDNKDLISDPPTRLLKSDIIGLRYGIKWINGYQFVIGRIYCIDLLSADKEILRIRLKSIYGIRKQQLTEKYGIIVNALYDNFFDDVTRNYLNQFSDKRDFELANIFFTQTGLTLDSKSEIIPWEDIGTKSYSTYYAIFSKSNPTRYKTIEYLNDWNTGVLYSVSREILMDKGLHHE
jgi:hypothetical protein